MSNNSACAEYLKQHTAYHRCMKELRQKWQSHGRAAGRIVLKAASDAEKRAIGGIVGKTFFDDKVSFTFLEFEQGLQKTRFAPIDMKEVLEHYFACEMRTNKEKRQQKQDEKENFLEEICRELQKETGDGSCAVQWLREVQESKKYGYQILIKEFEKNHIEAGRLAKNAGRALAKLEKLADGEEKLLAVLSAEISGNPHYFDLGTPSAQLLMNAICRWKGYEYPQNAYEWRSHMADAGIISDNIASMVHAYGVHMETEDGIHAAYEVFREKKEPYVITAENLRTIVRASAADDKVYVVENEMVFLYLLEHVKNRDITCLCTSGQPRVAAYGLISLLVESGAAVFYSGDLDAEGMGIADRLWQKYGAAVHLWRMEEQDYKASISGEPLSDKQLVSLELLKNPILQRTAEAVKREKKAGYQENMLGGLLEDLQNG